jgi:hypothetical protein
MVRPRAAHAVDQMEAVLRRWPTVGREVGDERKVHDDLDERREDRQRSAWGRSPLISDRQTLRASRRAGMRGST